MRQARSTPFRAPRLRIQEQDHASPVFGINDDAFEIDIRLAGKANVVVANVGAD